MLSVLSVMHSQVHNFFEINSEQEQKEFEARKQTSERKMRIKTNHLDPHFVSDITVSSLYQN